MEQPSPGQINAMMLRQVLVDRFNDSELRDLCADLEVDYEDLPGQAKSAKARELVAYIMRRRRINDLVTYIDNLRPNIDWQQITQTITPVSVSAPYFGRQIIQLRAPINDFIGREQEIVQLVHSLSTAASGDTAAISGVYGMGGIGKTELAYVVAHRLRNTFPAIRLLVELQGTGDKPLTPEQALQTILHSFEYEAELPEELSQLQKIYQDKLANQQALILLDDVKDAAQVHTLWPPPGCALLITSRNLFTLPGMTMLNLGMLLPEEAENLLRDICSRVNEYAPKLAELCGYLPLALRVSASLLATNPSRNVARYLEQLKAERLHYLKNLDNPNDPQGSVEASLSLSYKALGLAEQLALSQLSVFPVSFDSKAAESVVAVDGDIGETLELLLRRNLLEWHDQTERYNLHTLVHIFANDRLSTTERNDTFQRYNVYYLVLAEKAEPELTGAQQGHWLDLLDREHDHLQTALQQMLDAGDDESSLRLAGALWRFWAARGYLQKGRYWLNKTLNQPSEVLLSTPEHMRARAKALKGAGQLAVQQSDYGQALLLYEESLKLQEILGDLLGIATVLNDLGGVAHYQGNYEQAYEFYTRSLDLLRQLNHRRGVAMLLGNLGFLTQDKGRYPEAISYYGESLTIFQDIEDHHSIAMYLGNLGNAFRYQGEYIQAKKYYQESLDLRRKLKDRRGIASSLDNLGWVALYEGALEQAVKYFMDSLDKFYELEERIGIIDVLEGLADVAVARQQFGKATCLLGAVETLRKQINTTRSVPEQSRHQHTMDTIRAYLDDTTFATEYTTGQGLTEEQAIAEARIG